MRSVGAWFRLLVLAVGLGGLLVGLWFAFTAALDRRIFSADGSVVGALLVLACATPALGFWWGRRLLPAMGRPPPAPAPGPAPPPPPAAAGWAIGWEGAALLLALPVLPLSEAVRGGDDLLPGRSAEALAGSLWLDGWVTHWLGSGGPLLRSETIFWPVGGDLLTIYGAVGTGFLAAPFFAMFGYPGGYLPFVWAMMSLNGLSAAILGRYLGLDRQGALLAAGAWALSPPLLAAVSQGEQLWFTAFTLPWVLGAAMALGRAPRAARGLHLCVALAVTVSLSAMMGLLAAIAAAGVLLFALIGRRRTALIGALRPVPLFALVGLALLIPLAAALARGEVAGLRVWAVDGLDQMDLLGGQLDGLALAHLTHPVALIGGAGGVDTLWRLVVVGALAGVVLRGPAHLRPWVGGGAALVALGLGAGVVQGDRIWTAPLGLLQVLVPLLGRLHHAERWFLLAALPLCLALGAAWPRLRAALPRPLQAAAWLAALALLVGMPWWTGAAPLPASAISRPAWLELIGEGAVAVLPIGWSDLPIAWDDDPTRSWATGPGSHRQARGKTAFAEALKAGSVLGPLSGAETVDLASLVSLREAGLRYVVVDHRFVDAISARTQGSDQVTTLFAHLQSLEQALGPALVRQADVAVYRLPDADTLLAYLEHQAPRSTPTTAPR